MRGAARAGLVGGGGGDWVERTAGSTTGGWFGSNGPSDVFDDDADEDDGVVEVLSDEAYREE